MSFTIKEIAEFTGSTPERIGNLVNDISKVNENPFETEWNNATEEQRQNCTEYKRLIEKEQSAGLTFEEKKKIFDLLDSIGDLTTAHVPESVLDNF